MAKQKAKNHFVVAFRDHKEDKVVYLKVGKIADSSLGIAFVALSDFVFETSSLVVNPDEENLAKRFADVQTLHLSIYSILSIEEVGAGKKKLQFQCDKSNILVLPRGPGLEPTTHK